MNHEIIDKFLAQRIPSHGGRAPVTEADFEALSIIINLLIESKWEPDADGDYPVEFHLVDRTRFEPAHFLDLPYLFKITSPGPELDMYQHRASRNAITALETMQRALDWRRR